MFVITRIQGYRGDYLWYGFPSTQQTLAHIQDQNRGLQKPLERRINPQFQACNSHIPRESLGWDHSTPLGAKQGQNITVLSVHREDRVGGESIQFSLQFNISVNRQWRAKISDTFSVWFPVDKSPWGKSLFRFQRLRWFSQHIACQALLIGSSSLQTEFIDPHTHAAILVRLCLWPVLIMPRSQDTSMRVEKLQPSNMNDETHLENSLNKT